MSGILQVETKHCNGCKETKNLLDFSTNKEASDGRQSWCKACAAARTRKWYEARKASGSLPKRDRWTEADRDRAYKRKYGITLHAARQHLEGQGHRCAICLDPVSLEVRQAGKAGGKAVIDHCQTTGEYRGILCHHCNHGLGQFKDNAEALRRAIDYLSRAG